MKLSAAREGPTFKLPTPVSCNLQRQEHHQKSMLHREQKTVLRIEDNLLVSHLQIINCHGKGKIHVLTNPSALR